MRLAQDRSDAFEECFFGRQRTVDISNDGEVDEPRQRDMITVPEGYTVVSSGGMGAVGITDGVVLFCR